MALTQDGVPRDAFWSDDEDGFDVPLPRDPVAAAQESQERKYNPTAPAFTPTTTAADGDEKKQGRKRSRSTDRQQDEQKRKTTGERGAEKRRRYQRASRAGRGRGRGIAFNPSVPRQARGEGQLSGRRRFEISERRRRQVVKREDLYAEPRRPLALPGSSALASQARSSRPTQYMPSVSSFMDYRHARFPDFVLADGSVVFYRMTARDTREYLSAPSARELEEYDANADVLWAVLDVERIAQLRYRPDTAVASLSRRLREFRNFEVCTVFQFTANGARSYVTYGSTARHFGGGGGGGGADNSSFATTRRRLPDRPLFAPPTPRVGSATLGASLFNNDDTRYDSDDDDTRSTISSVLKRNQHSHQAFMSLTTGEPIEMHVGRVRQNTRPNAKVVCLHVTYSSDTRPRASRDV